MNLAGKRLGLGAAAFLTMAGVALVAPNVASAHHPNIAASTACTADGWTVTYTVTADADRDKEWRVNGSGWQADEIPFVFNVTRTFDQNGHSFTATADWREGGPTGQQRTKSVTKPSNCTPPTTTQPPTTTTQPPTTTTQPPTTTTQPPTTTTQPPTTTTQPPTTTVAVAGLQLTYMMDCAPDLKNTWRVRNPNGFPVEYTWNTAQGSSGGPLTAPPGDSTFETPRGPETMRIFVNLVLQQTKASGNDVDPSDPKCQTTTTTTQPPTTTVPVAGLQLTYMMDCAPDLKNTWRVRNPNGFPVEYTWSTAQGSTGGPSTAPPGDSIFETPRGPETMRIFVNLVLQQTKASGNDVDPSDPKCQTTTTTTQPPTTTTQPPTTTTQPPTTTTQPPTTTTDPDGLDITAIGPVCLKDAPYIDVTFGEQPQFNGQQTTVTFIDLDGNVVGTDTATYQAGATVRFVYPGASVDAAGNPVDWPGWRFNGSEWVVDPSDARLREGLTVVVEVNPSTSATVSYPPATAACVADPPTIDAAPAAPAPLGQLPQTGSSTGVLAIIAAALLLAGGLALTATRRSAAAR